jgi:CyaY protein
MTDDRANPSEFEYLQAAGAVLTRIEDALEEQDLNLGLDLDIARRGKLLEITFANRSQIVVNLQPPLQEIWLAARSGGYHFKCENGVWREREGQEFFAVLSAACTLHAGREVRLAAG